MSEFACGNGHLMSSGEMQCHICGGRIMTMDGKSAREIQAEEDYYGSMNDVDDIGPEGKMKK